MATKLADAALTIFVQTCRDELANASRDDIEVACAAMRAQAGSVYNGLLDDVRTAPWIGEKAFRAAALELAQAGIAAFRNPGYPQAESSHG